MKEKKNKLRFLVQSALFASLLSLLCPWVIPIGTVGITLATMLLLTLALSQKPVVALTVTAVYLAIGALGLPVFSHFTGGFSAFLSPSGGFLIGYLPFVAIPTLTKGRIQRLWVRISSVVAGHLVLYMLGAAFFAAVCQVSLREAFILSVLPFLLPDAIKATLAVYAARLLERRKALL